MLLLNVGEAPTLLRNRLGNGNHCVSFELAGARSNRAAIGARLTLRAGSLVQLGEVRGGSSYLSQNDLRLHFGLGARTTIGLGRGLVAERRGRSPGRSRRRRGLPHRRGEGGGSAGVLRRALTTPAPERGARRHPGALIAVAGVAALAGGWRPATSRDAQPGSGHPFASVSPAASRIDWTRTAGKSATKYLPETTGAGAAFLDYNNDGRMDVYLVNSGPCDFFRPQRPLRNALYRNDGDGGFTDVTEQAGVGGGGFGQGAAAGDYDADGFTDLYVTQYGRSILYRNNRDGSFTDATDKAGVGAPGWAASAAWFEYDNDGRLDLFVCRFADFDRPNTAPATTAASRNTASPGWASSEAWR